MSKPDLVSMQRALEDSPEDAHLLYQLGQHHEAADEFEAAASCYLRALALSTADQPYRHDLVIRAIYTLKRAGRHEEGIGLADSEMDNWSTSPDYYFALGDLLLDWATRNPGSVDELIPMVEASWKKCLEIGERPELAGAVAGRGSYLAAYNLSVMYGGLGDTAQADYYRALSGR